MVDFRARSELKILIEDFLYDRIGSYGFDERLHEIRYRTRDETVYKVTFMLWGFYDDLEDHKACLSKQEWDVIQRLALVLDSGCEIQEISFYRRHQSQLVALLTLISMAIAIWWINIHFLTVLAVGGLVCSVLTKWRDSINPPLEQTHDFNSWPFRNPTQIRKIWRCTPTFKRCRYRKEIETRVVRAPSSEWLMRFRSRITMHLAVPIFLMGQCFPLSEIKTEVIEP